MRKHKSVVAILLAVMMIFTFMPTMAFAETSNLVLNSMWNDTFTSVKIGDTNYTQIARTWSDGVVTADVDYNKYSPSTRPAPLSDGQKGYYYDLANSEIAGPSIWTRSDFESLKPSTEGTLDSGAVMLHVSLKDKISTTAKSAVNFDQAYRNQFFTVTYKYSGFDAENLGEQKVTVTAVINPITTNPMSGKEFSPEVREMLSKCLVGEVPAKEITVKAATLDYNAAKFDFDEVTKDKAVTWGNNMLMTYDGAAHTIVNSSVDGWTYTYALQDATTGKYNPGTVSVKDAGKYNVKVTATYKDSTKPTHNAYITVTVQQANEFKFGFKNMDHESNFYAPVPVGADPYDYVAVTGVCDADAEAAMAYFKDKYTVEVTKSASESSVYTWKIVKNKSYDKTSAAKTYKSLFDNYKNSAADTYEQDVKAPSSVVVVERDVENTKIDDITFSGVTTKSFKAKKKTKKLAKAKTFQVVAKADSGNVITFSATSSNGKVSIDETGVVTVKKGLKKGAKVKLVVKAKTVAGNGYKTASAEKTYTIKIK